MRSSQVAALSWEGTGKMAGSLEWAVQWRDDSVS